MRGSSLAVKHYTKYNNENAIIFVCICQTIQFGLMYVHSFTHSQSELLEVKERNYECMGIKDTFISGNPDSLL